MSISNSVRIMNTLNKSTPENNCLCNDNAVGIAQTCGAVLYY